MEKRRIGSSDLVVSSICYGTMTFGQQNTQDEAMALCEAAYKAGINFFDVAELYPVPRKRETQGLSEIYLGQWLKTQKREDVVVASKVAGYDESVPWIPANRHVPKEEESVPRLDAKSIEDACNASLCRLETSYLDLYQLHWPDRYVPAFGYGNYDVSKERVAVRFEEQARALAKLIGEGKIRYWGLSNETTFGVSEFYHVCEKFDLPKPVSIQNSYSLLHRSFETELAEACSPRNYNISLLPWSPLAGGMLTGKYNDKETWPADGRFSLFPGYMNRFYKPECVAATQAYTSLAAELGITTAQLAIAFTLQHPFVASTIIGATKLNQLEENIAAAKIRLSAEAMQKINEIHMRCRNPQFDD
eukprot:comp22826_c0_seq1/m.35878 comp22826_c0_seq1/g.35878  ORF comp22826_c0_seq1/g.35878 comp22826_c0_seq1/m.35878 type:complete len:361 (-) comp22826_c0_seq1:152-1234(-)